MSTTDRDTTVRALWESFLEAADPRGTLRPAQEREMRLAYYAGCQGMLAMIVATLGRMDEDTGMRLLESLQAELSRFADLIRDGRA